jgi:hypothetical protein
MEDSIFGPKPARCFNLDNSDFDGVDNNENIPSDIEIFDVENVNLSKKTDSNKYSRDDLIKLLSFITLKLSTDVLSKP